MGYACPVCGTPEVDGRHLANHVAFTALTGDDDHEVWLDEHVPGWGELGDTALAERVVPPAEETDVADAVEEGGTRPAVDRQPTPAPELDADAASVLAEAREYTRQMAEADGDSGESDRTNSETEDETGSGTDGESRTEGNDADETE